MSRHPSYSHNSHAFNDSLDLLHVFMRLAEANKLKDGILYECTQLHTPALPPLRDRDPTRLRPAALTCTSTDSGEESVRLEYLTLMVKQLEGRLAPTWGSTVAFINAPS